MRPIPTAAANPKNHPDSTPSRQPIAANGAQIRLCLLFLSLIQAMSGYFYTTHRSNRTPSSLTEAIISPLPDPESSQILALTTTPQTRTVRTGSERGMFQ